MPPTLSVYVDDDTMTRLERIAREMGTTPTWLAEAAVTEEALKYYANRDDDPAEPAKPRGKRFL